MPLMSMLLRTLGRAPFEIREGVLIDLAMRTR
jgi:hypothetical protein